MVDCSYRPNAFVYKAQYRETSTLTFVAQIGLMQPQTMQRSANTTAYEQLNRNNSKANLHSVLARL
jgi:hypothetical protein